MSAREVYSTVLVDDVPEVVTLMRRLLAATERFRIVGEAADGVRAVAVVAEVQPDLVLLDLSMPRMDGLEALPALREVSPDSRVVILSVRDVDGAWPAALQEGASGYISKDLPPQAMIRRLLEIMEGPSSPALGAPRPAPVGRIPESSVPPVLDLTAEEMISLVAHEVRNHLSVIQGFGAEVHGRWDEIPDEVRRDSVLRMTERARYLNTVVNNLMFMRRLESGHVWTEPTELEIEELMRATHDELNDLARGHELRIDLEDPPPAVRADTLRLRQVLTNLVVNAARYSPAERPIVLGVRRDGDRVLIEVKDEGPGVAPRFAETIFEPFRRLERGGSGIGLGLFISRELMRSMAGDLWLATSSTDGATFVCSLPAT